jgi:aminomethyltransferase
LSLKPETLEEYLAVREAVGWRDLSHRGKIRVTGPDRLPFLHAMLSNEVQALAEFSGRYGTLLTATGKIVADFHYYRFPDEFLIDIESTLLDRLVERLSAHIIMDDVTLEDVSGRYRHLAVEGPKARILLERAGFRELPEDPLTLAMIPRRETMVAMIRRDLLSDSGWELLGPSDSEIPLPAVIEEAGGGLGLRAVGEDAFEVLRLERGIPLFGIDFSEKNNPLEARLDSAYSLTKGCYPGQEVLAKATHIGGVARLRACLAVEGEWIPQAGGKVWTGEGAEAGWITSSAFSPRRGTPVALAYLKRAFAAPGNRVAVEVAEGCKSAATVVERFD